MMPYCSASSVIVNRPLWYSVTRCIRWSIGNNSCHGIRILPRRGGETCYPCRWTEVLPMSLDRAVAPTDTHVPGRPDLGPGTSDQGHETSNQGPGTRLALTPPSLQFPLGLQSLQLDLGVIRELHRGGDRHVPGAAGDQRVHLLADAAVSGVPLRRRAQLDDVHRFARVHLHVKPDAVGHRD